MSLVRVQLGESFKKVGKFIIIFFMLVVKFSVRQMKRISELLKKGNDVVLKMVKDKITIVYQKPHILKIE